MMKSLLLFLITLSAPAFATESNPDYCPVLNGSWECDLTEANGDVEENIWPFSVQTKMDGEYPSYTVLGFGPYVADGKTVFGKAPSEKAITSCTAQGYIEFKAPKGGDAKKWASLQASPSGATFVYTIWKKMSRNYEMFETYDCNKKTRLP